MDILKRQLSSTVMDQLTKQIGASNQKQTSQATDGILEALLGGITKNARKDDGLSGLANALEKDHDGSILDNLEDIIQGRNIQPQQKRAMNGAGIVKHVLGGNAGNIVEMISKMSGLNGQQSGSLMEKLAPIVLATLGKQKRKNNLDMSGLGELLGGVSKQQQQRTKQSPLGGMLKGFLDQDGDGQIMDDVAGMLGRFLKK